jgi:hypothetical protein
MIENILINRMIPMNQFIDESRRSIYDNLEPSSSGFRDWIAVGLDDGQIVQVKSWHVAIG